MRVPRWAVVAAAMGSLAGAAFADASAGRGLPETLAEIAAGTAGHKSLRVSYSDLHGLHGGLTLAIEGESGRVTQKAVRTRAGKPKPVAHADMTRLVALLVKHRAWEQRVPERQAVPDESRAQLTISYLGRTATIWEWFNDLEANQRIVEIRELMKEIAWTAPPSP
jgi:hypothetical protein